MALVSLITRSKSEELKVSEVEEQSLREKTSNIDTYLRTHLQDSMEDEE